jgi:hypothetical protein
VRNGPSWIWTSITQAKWVYLDFELILNTICFFSPQRTRFEKHFSFAGFCRRIDQACAQIFGTEAAKEEESEKASKNGLFSNGTANGTSSPSSTSKSNGIYNGVIMIKKFFALIS